MGQPFLFTFIWTLPELFTFPACINSIGWSPTAWKHLMVPLYFCKILGSSHILMLVKKPMLIPNIHVVILMGFSTLSVAFYICYFKKNGSSAWTAPTWVATPDSDLRPHIQYVPVFSWIWGPGVNETDLIIKRKEQLNEELKTTKWKSQLTPPKSARRSAPALPSSVHVHPGERRARHPLSSGWLRKPCDWPSCFPLGSFRSILHTAVKVIL